jgi:hypothetical protein
MTTTKDQFDSTLATNVQPTPDQKSWAESFDNAQRPEIRLDYPEPEYINPIEDVTPDDDDFEDEKPKPRPKQRRPPVVEFDDDDFEPEPQPEPQPQRKKINSPKMKANMIKIAEGIDVGLQLACTRLARRPDIAPMFETDDYQRNEIADALMEIISELAGDVTNSPYARLALTLATAYGVPAAYLGYAIFAKKPMPEPEPEPEFAYVPQPEQQPQPQPQSTIDEHAEYRHAIENIKDELVSGKDWKSIRAYFGGRDETLHKYYRIAKKELRATGWSAKEPVVDFSTMLRPDMSEIDTLENVEKTRI